MGVGMMDVEVTPKSLLLDLLRVTPQPMQVRQLIAAGELFGFESNAMRVALTRLVSRGLAQSDERGTYRLAAGADRMTRWIDSWRRGEERVRAWNGEWLCAWLAKGTPRGDRRRSRRALEKLGLRASDDGLWVRPHNLRASTDDIVDLLNALGLADDATTFVGRDFPDDLQARWRAQLWRSEQIMGRCRSAIAAIERSERTVAELPLEHALVESFQVGGAAIRTLANDPLLPDDICSGDARRELTDATLRYDRLGRTFWVRFLADTEVVDAPSNLSAP